MERSAFATLARQVVLGLNLFGMKWRHHKFGMLQSELSETLRVHVWHPKLVQIDPDSPRAVHDHRFSLTSAIVAGELLDQPCMVSIYENVPASLDLLETPPKPEVLMAWQIKHAKIQTNTEADYTKLGPAVVTRMSRHRLEAGDTYIIRRREFHTTKVTGCAVTLIWRHDFDNDPARVLTALDGQLDMGTVKDPNVSLMHDVLGEAGALVQQCCKRDHNFDGNCDRHPERRNI